MARIPTQAMAAVACAVLALGVCGCAAQRLAAKDHSDMRGVLKADAYREAARRCGSAGVRLSEDSDGTAPSDYICGGQ